MSNRILVTGAAGFIGYHLCKSLLDDEFEVFGIDNINNYYDQNLKHSRLSNLNKYSNFTFEKADISDRSSISKVFQLFNPKKVINLAAQAGVRYSLKNPYAYLDSNLTGFLNIIELCRHNQVEGLIYASSSSVYGGNKNIPFDIGHTVNKPLSLYAVTKRSNELIAHSYSHLYDLNTTGLRYFTVYGPWGRPDMAMYIFTEKISQGESIPVFNNGNMKRDFTYIDDIILGTRAAIEKNYKCEIFNLGNSKSERLMDIISIMEKYIDKKAKINYLPIQPGDVVETYADINKSKEKLDFLPSVNVEDGIIRFIDWYKIFKNKEC
tara:strand:+ start:3718 stop:4683 length:966 start_codon:yes stop_codon:yes gene_type:complete